MTAFVQRLARPALTLAVASLPLVVLILTAAPGSCPGGGCSDDLMPPTASVVEVLP